MYLIKQCSELILPDNYEYQPLPLYIINQIMAIDYKYFSRIRIFVDFVVSEALAKNYIPS